MYRSKSLLGGGLIAVVLCSLFLSTRLAWAQDIYYRWAFAPAVTCNTVAGGVQAVFASQPVEWLNVPTGATYNIVYITNGASVSTGPFPLTPGSGSQSFGSLAMTGPSYPLSVAVRLETLVGGLQVYASTLSTTCTANGTTTSAVTNSGAGGVLFGAGSVLFDDGRINNRAEDAAQTAAIYCESDGGVTIWVVRNSVGTFAFTATRQDIDAVPANPAHNTIIKQGFNITLYRLAGGKLQVNAPNGYVYIWDHC